MVELWRSNSVDYKPVDYARLVGDGRRRAAATTAPAGPDPIDETSSPAPSTRSSGRLRCCVRRSGGRGRCGSPRRKRRAAAQTADHGILASGYGGDCRDARRHRQLHSAERERCGGISIRGRRFPCTERADHSVACSMACGAQCVGWVERKRNPSGRNDGFRKCSTRPRDTGPSGKCDCICLVATPAKSQGDRRPGLDLNQAVGPCTVPAYPLRHRADIIRSICGRDCNPGAILTLASQARAGQLCRNSAHRA